MSEILQRPRRKRAEQAQERRAAIVEAAIAEFIANGFAATRIDDIARRAGVAKGTVYLHFPDKEALFEGVVRAEIIPLAQRVSALLDIGQGPVRETIEKTLGLFMVAVVDTRVGDVMRLIAGEARRFPKVAETYRREVIMPLLDRLRTLLRHAAEKGELRNPAMAAFPQLLVAPMLMLVLSRGVAPDMFEDGGRAMIKAHLDTLFIG